MISKEKVLGFIERNSGKYTFYPASIKIKDENVFLIGKDSLRKYLFIVGELKVTDRFKGEIIEETHIENKKYTIKKAILSYDNLLKLKNIFLYLWPVTCNKGKSFGAGDRLGLVTAAHIRTFEDKNIFPILAQQSVREINRTERSWKDVINDAVWGYFEAGSNIAFGADADHIKEKSDIEKAVDAGFTMFTIDPSEYIQDTSNLDRSEMADIYNSLDDQSRLEKNYLGKNLVLSGKKYYIDQDMFIPIAVKYSRALEKVSNLYTILKDYIDSDYDFEVSMDEIEDPVTPLEHFFIASELIRAGIDFQNLALRFAGRWEKAIDYNGDIDIFEKELKEHSNVLKEFGGYKLSLHSGSEKFSIYRAFSKINEENFHIKTAGTSWLEALRVIALCCPRLFKDIFNCGLKRFEENKASYNLSTELSSLPNIDDTPEEELVNYMDMAGSRQVLHVAFGSILTSRDEKGEYLYRDKLYWQLFKNEDIHYKYVSSNIRKHLDLLSD